MERLPRLLTVVGTCGSVVLATLALAQEPPLQQPGGRVPAKGLLLAPPTAVRKQRSDVMQTPQDALKRRVEQLDRLKDGEMRDVRVINQQDFVRLQAQLQADQIRLQVEQITQQTVMQSRALLAGEFHFLRRACSPSDEQQHAIAHDALRTLRANARQQAESRFGRNTGGPPARPLVRDFSENARIAVAEAAKAHLNAQQLAAYESAAAERAEFRKQAALDNLVAALDSKLKLTTDQRDEVRKAISENWDEAWSRSMMGYLYGERFLPTIPDKVLVPLLDDNQRLLWKSMLHQNGVMLGTVMASTSPLEDPIFTEESERDEQEAQRESEAAAKAEQEKADKAEAAKTKQVPRKAR